MAKLLEEAKLPSTEPDQALWFQENHRGGTDLEHGELRKWTMEEFISTTISSEDSSWMTKTHLTPWVQWEILHPQLPILRITAHADQKLPLRPAGLAGYEKNTRRTAIQRVTAYPS